MYHAITAPAKTTDMLHVAYVECIMSGNAFALALRSERERERERERQREREKEYVCVCMHACMHVDKYMYTQI